MTDTTPSSRDIPIRAACLFIHGGMFSQGNCDAHPDVTHALVQDLRLAVLTATFRDGSQTTFGTDKALRDLQSCLAFLQQQFNKNDTHNHDNNNDNHDDAIMKIGVVGSSSGGWFAMHLCNSTVGATDLAFCIPLCPVADPHARAVYLKQCIRREPEPPLSQSQKEAEESIVMSPVTELTTFMKDIDIDNTYYPYHHEPDRAQRILDNQMQFFDNSWDQMLQAARDVSDNQNKVPTLLILGSHDKNIPPQAVQKAVVQWASRTIVVGGAGHDIQSTPPTGEDSYIPDIDRFLTRLAI